jgi:uncharacterized protein YndB with AHSA1/START domain
MEATVIKHSVTTTAPRERVWKAITSPKNLTKWMTETQFADLTVGEKIAFTNDGKTTYGSIAIVEPPQRFAYRWHAHPDHDVLSLVTFYLDEVDDGTRITVTEEGFEALPVEVRQAQIDDHTEGWHHVLNSALTTLSEDA